jgi:hypothetical protein
MLAPNPSQHLESEIPILGNPLPRFNQARSCSKWRDRVTKSVGDEKWIWLSSRSVRPISPHISIGCSPMTRVFQHGRPLNDESRLGSRAAGNGQSEMLSGFGAVLPLGSLKRSSVFRQFRSLTGTYRV